MNISFAINEMITTADSKALATYGPAGINVVPVSMIKINEHHLSNFGNVPFDIFSPVIRFKCHE